MGGVRNSQKPKWISTLTAARFVLTETCRVCNASASMRTLHSWAPGQQSQNKLSWVKRCSIWGCRKSCSPGLDTLSSTTLSGVSDHGLENAREESAEVGMMITCIPGIVLYPHQHVKLYRGVKTWIIAVFVNTIDLIWVCWHSDIQMSCSCRRSFSLFSFNKRFLSGLSCTPTFQKLPDR